ncbi:MAG: hypothetical protein ACRD2U_12855 [Terriglobales bacterium]
MPEDTPQSPATPGNPQPTASELQTPFDIGEEYGTAKKNLPPIKIVLIALAIVGVIAAIFALAQRPHSSATGSIDDVVSAEIPDQNMLMAAINISIQNHGKTAYRIKSIEAALDANGGPFSDDAASAVDFDRYYAAIPALKAHALTPLIPELKIDAGAEASGTVIVTFPVTADAFANRKSLTVTIQPYDQAVPLVLKK